MQYGGRDPAGSESRARTRQKLLRRAGLGAPDGLTWRAWLREQGLALMKRASSRRAVARGGPDVRGHLDGWDGSTLSGWAFVDGENGPARVVVRVDNREVVAVLADVDRPDVAAELGAEHRQSGFHIPLDAEALRGRQLSVWVGGRRLKTLPLNEQ